ncbi:WS/DGAT/MGAT family O-acyltransferase [Ornithinicoccus halotolerans]|uniref:WS/DGAT/MGAT family O-acyltransferase n=1 Tax=Ornithinicoccus halotolerans TaxID=1748220 RepID=UPI001297F9C1|nr:wax ester/triacylglycerol synthase family O-acyltransferase [Ornithinicoccus halotolerans]
MVDRLTPTDASFLYLEEPTTAMHVGTVLVFPTPEEGFGHETLLALVANRVAYVSRYRQKVRHLPAGVGGPVWVDDPDFDLTYHVRRAALPRPGTREQLAEFVARVQSRPLDRTRPLWEVYLVEGLEGDRFAVVTKTHQAMVDGVRGIELAQVVLDASPTEVTPVAQTWAPAPEPSSVELLARAAVGTATSPRRLVEGLRGGIADLRHTGARVAEVAQQAATTLVRSATSPAPPTPLNTRIGGARRLRLLDLDLADLRAVRARRFGSGDHGHVTVNDVVLATVAGALREWLLTRGEPVTAGSSVRAMVPVSVTGDAGQEPSAVGGGVVACLVDLPVGEPSPGMRLQQVSYRMAAQLAAGQAVGARGIAGLAGFAPSTLHSMATRVASAVSRRSFNLIVSNVPGPQDARYAGTARLEASYPVIPLPRGQALSVGLTSYDGRVHLGLHADRATLPDLDVLADGVLSALRELADDPT